jgi:hypothetical protein
LDSDSPESSKACDWSGLSQKPKIRDFPDKLALPREFSAGRELKDIGDWFAGTVSATKKSAQIDVIS